MGLLTFLDLNCPDGDHRQLLAKVSLTINSQGEIISAAPVALFCSFHQTASTKTFHLLSFQMLDVYEVKKDALAPPPTVPPELTLRHCCVGGPVSVEV